MYEVQVYSTYLNEWVRISNANCRQEAEQVIKACKASTTQWEANNQYRVLVKGYHRQCF